MEKIMKLELKPTDLITRFESYQCNICNGTGTCREEKIPCYSCKGKGYILVTLLSLKWKKL